MTRYLTPAKVGLLVLVSLYCDQNVPNASIMPVLSFVLKHLVPPSLQSNEGASSESHTKGTTSIEDFERATRQHQSIRPGRTLYDLFLNGLWSIDSLHALHEFFSRLEGYLALPGAQQEEEKPLGRIMLSRSSPLGMFFRRAQLEFTRLQFNDSTALWMGFLKFKAPTESAWKKRNHAAAGDSFDAAIDEFDVHNKDRLMIAAYGALDANDLDEAGPSQEDTERLLEFDLEKLQQFGLRVPKPVQDRIKSIVDRKSQTPHIAYFVNFFDAWRAGDFTGAFENLHRYFDYTVRTRDKGFYQYALLHMAVLQADFGCFDEAVAAMNETIATARENQDTSCLNFALSWLSHLSKAYPRDLKQAGYVGMLGSEKDRLAFLAEKAKEMKSWSLLSSTLLSEAKQALLVGSDPLIASEHLYQSSHLNFTHHLLNNCGTQLLIGSAKYARTGLNALAENDCEILLDCYADRSPADEVIRATCQLAQAAARLGRYSKVEELLESFSPETLRTLKLKQYVTTIASITKLKQTLRLYDLVAAEHMLAQLKTGAWSDPSLDFQIGMLELEYLVKQKSIATAMEKVDERLKDAAETQGDIMETVALMLFKAEIFSRMGQPGRGFTIVLRAASMAWGCKLTPLLWEAMAALANILNAFGEFEHAARVMDAVLPQALGASDIAAAAVLFSRQADAHMGMAGKAEKKSRQRMTLLSKTDGFVDKALGWYGKLHDVRGSCEMMAKKAVIAQLRGDAKLAEDWSTKYMALYDKHMGGEN